jgi:hypothetical protein
MDKINVNIYIKGGYAEFRPLEAAKNKAKQSQFSYFPVAKPGELALYSENSNSLRI